MLELKNISKNYGEIKALKNVTLKIEKGELFGLLGPNGAGKTTLINILDTLLPADEGEVFVGGLSLSEHRHKIKKLIGIVPQEIALYEDLTALENLRFWGEIYGITKSELKKKCDEILKSVGLFERRNDSLRKFSGGMKRRINIAAGLLHNPEIILLDEPTVGVDPQSRNFIFEMIKRLNSAGKTIIYTTHYMEEAEKLCRRIAIIDHGEIIALGTKEELLSHLEKEHSVLLKFKNAISDEFAEFLSRNEKIIIIDEFSLQVPTLNFADNLVKISENLKNKDNEIIEITTQKPNLETVFLKLTGRELRDE